jgi:squalene-hopene/tetraprenyl-beta-curcumene cyclase
MASLASWKRIDKTPQDVSNGDGYGTGLVVYVLRVAGGVLADDPAIRRGIGWIKSHQRQSGYWYTRSPKINDVLNTYAGTAYVVMALGVCGEMP